MGEFRRLHERSVHKGYAIEVRVATFEAPDGTTFERDVVHSRNAVAIVAVDEDERVTLVRQYRPALEDWLLELPAGLLDVDGEDALACAKRELVEEVGLEASEWRELCGFHNAAGQLDQYTTVFLARGLRSVPHDRQGVEEATMSIEHVALADGARLVADGTLHDAKTCIGVLMACHVLG